MQENFEFWFEEGKNRNVIKIWTSATSVFGATSVSATFELRSVIFTGVTIQVSLFTVKVPTGANKLLKKLTILKNLS